ncbi:FtsQ-type POTRA domain-containing protein [Rickettsiaceae bacterium]|nr:FtsQ-type POTRA domain-containing protein [Rickettsiaceae bacterium]
MTKRKKTSKRKTSRSNVSIRRRLLIYYQRTMLLLKFSLLVLVCLFFFTDIFKPFKDRLYSSFYNITAEYGFVFQEVEVDGQKNMPLKDVIAALQADEGEPIFAIDMAAVKDRLENHIWAKSAIIERRLPSKIYIAIIERTPVAIWQFKNKLYLVDSEGNRISKYEGSGFSELMHVVGSDANIYASNLLEDLSRHEALSTRVKSAVRYGQRRWNLNLDQKITVKMPEENFDDAYDYLHSLNKAKKLFDQGYKVLDLRDQEKYYLEKY